LVVGRAGFGDRLTLFAFPVRFTQGVEMAKHAVQDFAAVWMDTPAGDVEVASEQEAAAVLEITGYSRSWFNPAWWVRTDPQGVQSLVVIRFAE
jgi:hypothetical protein